MTLQQERMTQNLRCQITPEELAETAQRMAAAEVEARKLRDELAAEGAEIRGQIKKLVGDMHSYAIRLQNGSEERPVECEITRNLETMRMTTVRLDTGEQIADEVIPLGDASIQTMLGGSMGEQPHEDSTNPKKDDDATQS